MTTSSADGEGERGALLSLSHEESAAEAVGAKAHADGEGERGALLSLSHEESAAEAVGAKAHADGEGERGALLSLSHEESAAEAVGAKAHAPPERSMMERTTTERTPRSDVPWTALVQSQKGRSKLHQKLARTMMRTVERWQLIVPGDKILVAISGGKDSYAMLDMLWEAKRRAPFDFDVTAVHLDQAQPGYDGEKLIQWLEKSGVPFEILREDTYSIVKEGTREGQAYCFLCARLRRGILYSAAARLGCNKMALGHHRDDALETLLMNLCYAGKLQAMPAKYTTDDAKLEVIRPLIDVAEDDLRAFSLERAYPILPCNLCGSQDGLKRDEMARLLTELEGRIPDVRAVMHHAISNVRPTHLLDPEVREAWDERPAHVRPKEIVDGGPRKMTGTVVASGGSDSSNVGAARAIRNPLRIVNDEA